jgi:photosystem II stability/assembly factor-like uncharacterized protein
MKKKLLTLILFSGLALFAQTDPNLKWLHPSPQGNSINWVKVFDSKHWYMGGDQGMFVKTQDAGQSWYTNNTAGFPNSTYPNTQTYNKNNAAWFFDYDNGLIAGSGSYGLLKTTNGGITFDTIKILSASGRFNALFFLDRNTGYLTGNGTVGFMKTTDGGLTWTADPNFPVNQSLTNCYSIYALDQNHIWVTSDNGNVYWTNDGSSWNTYTVPTNGAYLDITFTDSKTGYMCGMGGLFASTSDGGNSWNAKFVSNQATFYKMKVSNNVIYMACYDTLFYKSTDKGVTWQTYTYVDNSQMFVGPVYGMDILDNVIIMAGSGGMTYESTNYGVTWKTLSQKVSDASFVYSIYVDKSQSKIIACGSWPYYPGSIFYSNDKGQNWKASPYVPGMRINSMQMFDDNNGFFGGEYSYVAKTHDGGITVDTIGLSSAYQNLNINLVRFRNPNLGWLIGGYPMPTINRTGLLLKTTDGGASWIDQTPDVYQFLLSADFANDSVGWVGGRNHLYKTTNGGNNWLPQTPPGVPGDYIYNISVIDTSKLYLQLQTQIYRSLDGGLSWNLIPLPVSINFIFGMQWLNYNVGVICGTLGVIAKTTNAGQSWTIMNTGGWTAYGINIVNPDTFYIGAGYGQVFRYAVNNPVPVELSSFIGNVSGNNVNIYWSTAAEKNNLGFDIERGTSLNNFTKLSFIKGKGTSTLINQYSYVDKELVPGVYYYRIKQTDLDGSFKYYYLGTEIHIGAPKQFELSQNYPNPFNPSTIIKYDIPQDGRVTLKIYNILGKEIAVLVNDFQKAGSYSFNFDAHKLSSGVYLYKLESGNFTDTKKLTLIK